jgi:hypothetical protein
MPLAETIGQVVVGQTTVEAGGGIFSQIGQWGNSLAPSGFIPYEQGRLLYTLGFVDIDAWDGFRLALGMRGDLRPVDIYRLTEWAQGRAHFRGTTFNQEMHINDRAMQTLRYVPSIQETLFLFNRRLISQALLHHYLSINTAGEPGMINAWTNARYEIPGPSDLIRFAVREAFTPQAVQEFGYHKEFPVAILPFMEMQGYGQTLPVQIPPGATTTAGPDNRQFANWSDLYWWSHWDLPSPTQGYNMLHRLYSSSDYGPSPDYDPSVKFLDHDLDMLLKTADYPEYFRRRLTRISYNPLTRVDVRRMYKMDSLDEAGVYHAYRAIGYNDRNAKLLLEWTKKEAFKEMLKKVKFLTVKEIEEIWETGTAGEDWIQNTLKEIGIPVPHIKPIINGFKLRKKMKQVRKALKLAKEGFMTGLLDFDGIFEMLSGVGIITQRIGEYLTEWEQERFVMRRYLSAQANINYAVDGLINEQQLRNQLRNLNYGPEEINLMVAGVYQKRATIVKKEFEKQAREQKKALKEKIADLIRPYTDKNMVKWYKKGLLDLEDVTTILMLRKWKIDAISDWINAELGEEIEIEDDQTVDYQPGEGPDNEDER